MPCAARTRPCSPVAAGSPTTWMPPARRTPRSCAPAVAHAVIRKVDAAPARGMPGVIAVITGRDLAADDIGDIPPVASFNGRDGRPMFQARMPVLAAERVRYVGEAVAVVVAATADQARDAAEAVVVELDALRRRSRCGARDGAGRAGHLAGRAGQCRARLGGRRRGRGRCRVRACRARRAGATDRHPSCSERDGAARRHSQLRRGQRTLHAGGADAGRGGGPQGAGRGRLQGPGEPDPHPHARRGRRLRHEGADLFRLRRLAVRGPSRRADRCDGARPGWRAFSPIPTGATACWRRSWRSMPAAGSSACGRAPSSGSAPTPPRSPRSSRPPTPRTACPASMSFRRSTSA